MNKRTYKWVECIEEALWEGIDIVLSATCQIVTTIIKGIINAI
ncbi:hypothetical protein [Paraclostridium bifermentans]